MKSLNRLTTAFATTTLLISGLLVTQESKTPDLPFAMIDGNGPGWSELKFEDFVNINCKEDTWSAEDGLIKCNGNCNGGFRSKEQYTNFEMVMEWKHLRRSGNAGVFIWSPKETTDKMKPGELPQGIEIQILDHGYAEDYEKKQGKKPDWFTTHGDVFPCGVAKMKPFEPAAPNGARSFPSAEHSKGVGEWNHYYIRAINGEVRLWVNGHEVAETSVVLQVASLPSKRKVLLLTTAIFVCVFCLRI